MSDMTDSSVEIKTGIISLLVSKPCAVILTVRGRALGCLIKHLNRHKKLTAPIYTCINESIEIEIDSRHKVLSSISSS